MLEGIRACDFEAATALGSKYGGEYLYRAGSISLLLPQHPGFGTVRQESAEEHLDVRVIILRVHILCINESRHLGYSWKIVCYKINTIALRLIYCFI